MPKRIVGVGVTGLFCVCLSACSGPADNAPKEPARHVSERVVLQNPVGEIQAFAGSVTGTRGFSPSGTAASSALLNSPQGVAWGPDGKLYIADTGNNRIVRVDNGVITTVVAGQTTAGGVGYGNLLANPGAETPQTTSGVVPGWQGWTAGSVWNAITRDASTPTRPEPLDGDFYLVSGASATDRLLEKIDVSMYPGVANGTQWFSFTAFVASLDEGVNSDQAEIVVQYRGSGSTVLGFFDSQPIASTHGWTRVHDVRAAPAGTLSIWVNLISTRQAGTGDDAYYDGLSLRALPAGNTVGDGGPAVNATLEKPRGIAFGQDGALYIADSYNNRIRRAVIGGNISSIGSGTPGTADGSATTAQFNDPVDVTAGKDGSIGVADLLSPNLRIISAPASSPSVISLSFYGSSTNVLSYPSGGAQDQTSGVIWVSDRGNFRPAFAQLDAFGNALPATSLGGGRGFADQTVPQATSSLGLFGRLQGVAIAPQVAGSSQYVAGSAFFADLTNHAVRHVGVDQEVQTVVGKTGVLGNSGDNGPGYQATLAQPSALAFNTQNQLFIADAENNRIRVLNCASWDRCAGTDLSCSSTGQATVVSNPVAVSDGNLCTKDLCAWSTASVTHPPEIVGTSCSDNNACNGLETCNADTTCNPGTPVNINDNNPCTADSCNPSDGTVTHANVSAGTACPDSNLCNGTETCNGSGACLPGTPLVVDDGNPCTVDGCNAQTGATHTALNGTSCDDGTVCNGHESCVQGVCSAGTALNVNDGNACTADSCDPIAGVVHTAIVTDDGNACTTDSCNTTTGVVSHTARANGSLCGDPCQNQVCQAGACVAGTPAVVDDGVACTLDTCTDSAGVHHHGCSTNDRTVSSVMANVDAFLFQGSDPVQTGVSAGTLDPKMFAVIRGRVYDKNSVAISGVPISVVGHPEFGSTVSQGNGAFDLAVNGGQTLRLRFALPPYLPAERTVQVPVQDYVTASDVALIKPDSVAVPVDLSGSSTDIQVAQGTSVSDNSGTRRATLFVPPGTLAAMVLPNNSQQSLAAMHVRETEYSVGTTGPNAQPATLPPGLAYGYTVELSTDEALAAGATEVDFSKPLALYVDNFLSLPVGTPVPHGFYSASLGSWVPAPSGVVLNILSISGGVANIDLDGDGNADSSTALAAVGITDLERSHLGSLYAAGKKLWRTPVTHFSSQGISWPDGPNTPNECTAHVCHVPNGTTPMPCVTGMLTHECIVPGFPDSCADVPSNYCQAHGVNNINIAGCTGDQCFIYCCPQGYNPNVKTGNCEADSANGGGNNQPDSCDDPPPPTPPTNDGPGDCERPNASTIRCQRESLGEDLAIAGTPYVLHYESDRQRGRVAGLNIPLTSGITRPGLLNVKLQVGIAGQTFAPVPFGNTANQSTPFIWDGTDAYGRLLQGGQPVTVTVTSTFSGAYRKTDAFGLTGNGGTIAGVTTRQPFTVSNTWHGVLGGWDSLPIGLGGWSLNIHHAYDVSGRALRLGDGTNRTLAHIPPVIQTYAGNGSATGASGDGGSATAAGLPTPTSVAVGSDGSVYISDGQSCVRRVTPGGIIGPFAGQCGSPGFSGDNAAATSAKLRAPSGIAVAPDGTLYIADTQNQRVRRVFPSGIIQTVAGSGPTGTSSGSFSGDGGNALLATFNSPSGVDVGANGVLYIADSLNGRIRSVTPDGTVRTIAGNGGTTVTGNDGAATAASLASPSRVRVGSDGSLFIAEPSGQMVRRIGHDGIIHAFAGFASSSTAGYAGDGSQAKGALLSSPTDIAIASDGTVYIIDQNNTVRSVAPNGVIGTFAGIAGSTGFSGDGGLAATATFSSSQGIAAAPDGTVYIANTADNRVRRVGAALTGFSANNSIFQFASADGRRLDNFDGQGRHISTTDALTGGMLAQFGYDASGRLTTVTDADQNVTHINHDTSGNPTNMVGPFNQKTTFTVDGHGYLKTVTDPDTHVTSFTYDANGLMLTKTANQQLSQYSYDALGRLQLDKDAAGGSITVSHVDVPTGSTVSLKTALGRTTTYQTKSTADGAFSRVNTAPSTVSGSLQLAKGTITTTAPDGTTVTSTPIPDPQFGMLAPTMAIKTTLPSQKTQLRTVSRTVARSGGTVTTVTETTNLNGNTWMRMFDVASRTWTDSSPLGRITTTAVDAVGRPLSVTVKGITKQTSLFDSFGRLKNIDQGVRDEAFTYFATTDAQNGYLQKVTNPLLQNTLYTRDSFGRELSETAPDTTVTGFSWDPVGNLSTVTPPGQPAHNLSYSPVNLLSLYTPPTLASVATPQTKYDYDLDRNLTMVTRPDGIQLTYGYDTAGRLITITPPTGSATGTITRTYDIQSGRLATIANSADNVSIAFTFDGPLHTRSDYSGLISGAVVRQYNADFRPFREVVTGTSVADGYFGYDSDGLITCVSPSTCSPPGADAFTLVHDPDNGLLKSTALRTIAHSLSYNAFGELATESALSGSTALYSETYDNSTNARDNLGRITRKTETLQGSTTVFDYTYWPGGQLKTVSQGGTQIASYAYDSNGNRLSVTTPGGTTNATYDAQDRLITYGTFTYTYTANGELNTKTNSVGNAVTHYTYDVYGNLKRVDLPNGDFVEYLVDGQNRRVAKKKNGTFVKKWLYRDQLHPVEEMDGAGNFVSRFMYASGKNSPDYMVQGGVEYRILSDQLGSPRLVVNSSTGAVLQRMREDEFGVVIEDTSPGFTPFGFAGGLYDADTGLVRFGARDYDPVVGRWISKDPIRFRGGQSNFYVYVNDDPINRIDPRGLGNPLGDLAKALGKDIVGVPDTAEWCLTNPGLCGATVAGLSCVLAVHAILTGEPGELTWGDVERQSSAYSKSPYTPGSHPPAALPNQPPAQAANPNCSIQSSIDCP